jgi:uncharacterized protein (DUF2235 family)
MALRKLVVCADGTWNQVEKADAGTFVSTNVSKLASALARTDAEGNPQILCYLEGVGTHPEERIGGGAFGSGLSINLLRAYRFLVETYEAGDSLHFFGFSRGAFTVRSLAGMLANSGLLRRDARATIDDAFALYRDRSPQTSSSSVRARVFRQMHSNEVKVEFLGVWDTVGTLGVPLLTHRIWQWLGYAWKFHDVELSDQVLHACQALAIHERRSKFVPNVWKKPKSQSGQTLEQVWFCGAHADIGGGYCDTALSDLALDWMVERASAHDRGALAFRPNWKTDCGWRGRAEGTLHDEFKGFFARLDRIAGKPRGALREYQELENDPKFETRESLHPSVRRRYGASVKTAFWPPSFETALKRPFAEP